MEGGGGEGANKAFSETKSLSKSKLGEKASERGKEKYEEGEETFLYADRIFCRECSQGRKNETSQGGWQGQGNSLSTKVRVCVDSV